MIATARRRTLEVTQNGAWLVAKFAEPVRTCSWAIVGGGFSHARHVAWLEVRDEELRPPLDPRRMLRDRLRAAGMADAVGLMTSRDVSTYTDACVEEARCIATVGLGNALRAGDPAGIAGRIGTINLLVHVDAPLSDEAMLEASAIATEAKCAAVLESGVSSRRTGRPATGTGTDCTVVTSTGGRVQYAGKHTTIGAAVGAAVEQAVVAGVRRWLAEQSCTR